MNGKNRRGGPANGPGGSSAHRQASEWLVLLESGDATEEDRARFEEWLAEDPGHREAYAALGETWGRLAAMRDRVGTVDAGPGLEVVIKGLDVSGRARRPQRALTWAVAAAVLAVGILGGIVFQTGDSRIPYRTHVGEHRTVSLTDRSTVELNTDTELVVEYTDERRQVAMLRGEAFFKVVEDDGRPFIVTAGRSAIRAVGTGFAVRMKSRGIVSVMVTEGVVEVIASTVDDPGTGYPTQTVKPPVLKRGQRAEYETQPTRIEEVTPEELERAQSWRRGLLVFEDASLAEVIAEANRYTETQLVLADPGLGELRLGGTFKTGHVDTLLEVLKKAFGIRVDRPRQGTIELHATTPDSPPATS